MATLESLSKPPAGVELIHFITTGAVPHDAHGRATTAYRHRTIFVGSDIRAAVRQGLAEYVPMSVARVPEMIAMGRIPVDVALIQVSLPDEFGYVSLGVSVDVIPAAVARARLVIAEVNPSMPRTMGDSTLHIDRIHHLVPVDTAVTEYVHPATPLGVVEQIARYIGGIIEDGATLHLGLGRVASEALKYLHGRKDIGIHSDVITDAIIPLLESGTLTGRCRDSQRGEDRDQFRAGDEAPLRLDRSKPVVLVPANRHRVQPGNDRCPAQDGLGDASICGDLSGQVCADQFQGEFYGGLAAQGEFLLGASRSPGGKAVICVASTSDDGTTSRIYAALPTGDGVHHRADRCSLCDHRIRNRIPFRKIDPRTSDCIDRHRPPEFPDLATGAGEGYGTVAAGPATGQHARVPGRG